MEKAVAVVMGAEKSQTSVTYCTYSKCTVRVAPSTGPGSNDDCSAHITMIVRQDATPLLGVALLSYLSLAGARRHSIYEVPCTM